MVAVIGSDGYVRRDIERLWGVGDPTAVFSHGAPKAPCPWPRLGATAMRATPSRLVTPDMIAADVRLAQVDPRGLWCTQPWVLLEHTRYYLSGRWERTGITSADRDVAANGYPIIVRDERDRLVIVAGHHRSLAAAIAGRNVLCRLMPDGTDAAVAVLPHLLVGADTALPAVRCASTSDAIRVVSAGRMALVPRDDIAQRAATVLAAALDNC